VEPYSLQQKVFTVKELNKSENSVVKVQIYSAQCAVCEGQSKNTISHLVKQSEKTDSLLDQWKSHAGCPSICTPYVVDEFHNYY
jgi:hypothetical protein